MKYIFFYLIFFESFYLSANFLDCDTLKDELKTWQGKVDSNEKNKIATSVRETIQEQLSEAQKKLAQLKEQNESKKQEQEIYDKQQEIKKEIDSLQEQKKAINPSIIPDNIKNYQLKPDAYQKFQEEIKKLLEHEKEVIKDPVKLEEAKKMGLQVSDKSIKDLEYKVNWTEHQLLEDEKKQLTESYQQSAKKQLQEIEDKIKKLKQDLGAQEHQLHALPEKNKQAIVTAQSEVDHLQQRLNRSDEEIIKEHNQFAQEQIKSTQKDISEKCSKP